MDEDESLQARFFAEDMQGEVEHQWKLSVLTYEERTLKLFEGDA